jgi:cytochrome c-type biogenesis protein CcmE
MNRKALSALLAAAACGVGLSLALVQEQPTYAFRVTKFVEQDVRDREVTIFGVLTPGTLCRVSAESGYRFTLSDHVPMPATSSPARALETLPIVYDGCAFPQTLRDVPGEAVIVGVQGERCATCHDFKATQVLARGSGSRAAASPPLCDALEPRM